jgi:hypothetical protein
MQNEKDVQVVHALPGRVRLKLHRLKNNNAYAAEIQRDLLKVRGVTHLEAHPQTGSLLIEYDPNVLEALSLHPSVFSCLGLPRSNFNKELEKDLPLAQGRVKNLKTARKGRTKMEGQPKPKKKSSKKTKVS